MTRITVSPSADCRETISYTQKSGTDLVPQQEILDPNLWGAKRRGSLSIPEPESDVTSLQFSDAEGEEGEEIEEDKEDEGTEKEEVGKKEEASNDEASDVMAPSDELKLKLAHYKLAQSCPLSNEDSRKKINSSSSI